MFILKNNGEIIARGNYKFSPEAVEVDKETVFVDGNIYFIDDDRIEKKGEEYQLKEVVNEQENQESDSL